MSQSRTSRLLGLGRGGRKQVKKRALRRGRRSRRVHLEALEDRRLLALVGITPGFPLSSANSTGSVNYNEATNAFVADATPLLFQETALSFPVFYSAPTTFDLQIEVDESGTLIGGVAGDDFVVTGSLDIDGDFVPDVTGTLLTGEVKAFGFADAASTDVFDVGLAVTGGALAVAGTFSGGGVRPAYFAGFDIGIRIDSENSTFTGDFNQSFSGGNKSSFGPIDPLPPTGDDPAQLGNFVWVDTNFNGIQDDGDTGVNGVTVNLYVDADGDGVAEPGGDDGAAVDSRVTADLNGVPGFYLFDNLDPGDYFVVFEPTTLPSGFEFTIQNAGGDDAVDSDADPVTGVAAVTTLESGESDLTWDAGIVPQVNPDIEIIKFVDKVVTTSTMTVLDFESLAAGDVVGTQFPGVVINGVNNRTGAQNAAMIFDSANPTGGDLDLGTPNQAFGGPGIGSGGASNQVALGNVLIISEDGDSSDPDDEAQGGTLTFTFDQPVTINHIELLDIDSNESGGSVVTLTTNSGTQTISIPAVGNNSVQQISIDADDVTQMEVNFVSSGAVSELKYTTTTEEKQWFDANEAPGVSFDLGEEIEFSYHVTNPGDVSLANVNVSDDNATPGDTSDDFNPAPVLAGSFNVGDTDNDNELDPGEEWIYTAVITATMAGQFTNIGDVVGTPINDNGDPIGDDVVDDDPANYNVQGVPGIQIEKLTNGVDADTPGEAVEIAAGQTVTWTYLVTNTGSTTFTLNDLAIVDDHGTPADTSDDIVPTFVPGSDQLADGLLSPGETWEFVADDVAQALASPGATSVIAFNGSSGLDGPNGNIRSFSADGVSVNASAFSRDSSGNWAEAFLGIFSGGLGVTDSSEGNGGNGRHRVDNIGRDNYVLFEFSENVVVDRAFLDSVVNDSDLSVWIGTIPGAFGNHVTLSDAVLAGLELNEVNNTGSSSSRWADFNDGQVSGNVLVLAASVEDSTPEDQFKIRKVKFQQLTPGIYSNLATV
ncbi:MAG: hypothetical protein MI861_01500, partial [Pirellulales bacterium]|nr:hypothetical protein [Pirellulales bacterium]